MKATLPDGQKRPVILVADHDDSSRERVGGLLASVGYDVVLIESADHLLGQRRCLARSCLVMDFRLQGMNGLDLYAKLKTDCNDLPVVFMSAYASIAVAVRAIKAGAVDFLAKPICEQALLDAVQAGLEHDALKQARQGALHEVEALYGSLSAREREVMWHVTRGLMNKQVAGILGLSEITVKVHRGNVMRKMKARSFADLIGKANALPATWDGRPDGAIPTGRFPMPPSSRLHEGTRGSAMAYA